MVGGELPNFQTVAELGSVTPLVNWKFDVGKKVMGAVDCGPLNSQKVLNSLLLSKSSAVTDAEAPMTSVGNVVAGKVVDVSERSNILFNSFVTPVKVL